MGTNVFQRHGAPAAAHLKAPGAELASEICAPPSQEHDLGEACNMRGWWLTWETSGGHWACYGVQVSVCAFDRHILSVEGTRKEIRVQGKQNASSIWNATQVSATNRRQAVTLSSPRNHKRRRQRQLNGFKCL